MFLTLFKTNFEKFRHDTVFIWSSLSIFGLLLFILIGLLWLWQKLPPLVPLYFSLPWGEEQLTQPLNLFLLLCLGIVIYILNTLLAMVLYTQSLYYSRLLSLSSAIFSLILTISVWQIVLLIM